jgi:hypothetical protein
LALRSELEENCALDEMGGPIISDSWVAREWAQSPAVRIIARIPGRVGGSAPSLMPTPLFAAAIHSQSFPGVGTIHCVVDSPVASCRAGLQDCRMPLTIRMSRLPEDQQSGSPSARPHSLCRHDLSIIHNVQSLLVIPEVSRLFRLANAPYKRGHLIPTSSKAFQAWGQLSGKEGDVGMLLDPSLQHPVVLDIQGKSAGRYAYAERLP